MLPQALERGMRVEIVSGEGVAATVQANRDALVAVIGNLLDNAIKYGPENSTIELSAFASGSRGRQVTIAVSDRGERLEPDEAKRIFERFYQADDRLSRRGGGVGLGLSIAQKLTELMAGSVGWRATEKGNLFYVELPAGMGDGSLVIDLETPMNHV